MEQAHDWSLIDEIEDDAPITDDAAQRVRAHAADGCFVCAIEEDESQWDDE